jgi:hypothetical protein
MGKVCSWVLGAALGDSVAMSSMLIKAVQELQRECTPVRWLMMDVKSTIATCAMAS